MVRPSQAYCAHTSAGTPTCWARWSTTGRGTSCGARGKDPAYWKNFNSTAQPKRVAPCLCSISGHSPGTMVQCSTNSSGCHARFILSILPGGVPRTPLALPNRIPALRTFFTPEKCSTSGCPQLCQIGFSLSDTCKRRQENDGVLLPCVDPSAKGRQPKSGHSALAHGPYRGARCHPMVRRCRERDHAQTSRL